MTKDRVVFSSGSWDLFHVGHLNMLRRSREHGTRLIVGVSTDELIASYKAAPPIIPFEERFEIISSLKCVDVVVKQTILTEIRQLQEHRVDVVTIGDDWRDRHLEGLEWMKQHGEVVYLPYSQGISTSVIKRRIIDNSDAIMAAALLREASRATERKTGRPPGLTGSAAVVASWPPPAAR